MRILVGCEFSGTVRDAFAARGHDAWSCDILPAPGQHLQCDLLTVLDRDWDLLIAHPPCTYLCSSGLHWNSRKPGRQRKTESALRFVQQIMNAPVPRIAIENPVGCISTRIKPPTQIIQPYQFGDDASKRTCLWLKNLNKLRPTEYFPPRITRGGKERWSNQNDYGQENSSGAVGQWAVRSKTFPGVARAMAEQWG